MSLINQMLRDLESRTTPNSAPSALQQNIQVAQAPASKIPLLWSLLAIITTSGSYWAYQYSKAQTKTPPVTVAENRIPAAPYEKVLAAPNAVTDAAQSTEQIPQKNTTAQPVVQTAPAVQPKPPAEPMQTVPAVQAAPELVAARPKKMPAVSNTAPINPIAVKQQAELLYRQAENKPEDYSAAYKLEQVLKLDPRHIKARLLLAQTLHNQGQTLKTAEVLDQSLALFPDNLQLINMRAQLFLQQKKPDGALKTLQRIELTNSSNETYLSLLAATYQQLQSFSYAARVYQRLVTVNPDKAENWLGLALSQEKLDNPKLTREAYQQALNKNTLKEPVVNYIKQRLNDLR